MIARLRLAARPVLLGLGSSLVAPLVRSIISGVGSFTLRARPNNANALITQYVGSNSNRESPI